MSISAGRGRRYPKYARIFASITLNGTRRGLSTIVILISFGDTQQYSPLMGPSGVLPEKVPQDSSPSKMPPPQVISEPTFSRVTDIGPQTAMVNECAIAFIMLDGSPAVQHIPWPLQWKCGRLRCRMKKSRVIIKSASYDYGTLRPLVFDMIDAFCGSMIGKGSRVVIKPNLLAPAAPERAMVTHPLIVRAVTEYVLGKGGLPRISDSPAMGGFERVLKESGIREALRGMEVEFREFRESVVFDTGEPFKEIEIARDALDADVLINLPKLKTHAQMGMTLGVKNLFGCICGLRKPEWHFRTGVNRQLFATLLVKIHYAISPAVTLMDGVLAMEGEGPGRSGTPRDLGIIAASDDACALDVSLCRMLGADPYDMPTNRAAREMGYAAGEIEVEGELPVVSDFRFPDVAPLVFGPPKLHGFFRRHLVQRPVPDESLCRQCGECGKYCPAKAISFEGGRLRFDYDRCIRCYCCIEVCPHAALRAAEPFLGRAVRRLKR